MSNVYKFPTAKERQSQSRGNLADPELQEKLREVINQLELEESLYEDLEVAVSSLLDSAHELVYVTNDSDTEELLRTAIMIVGKLAAVLKH